LEGVHPRVFCVCSLRFALEAAGHARFPVAHHISLDRLHNVATSITI
jgi:hypothetical protein